MSRILVTGATGFVGRTLCQMLALAGHTVRAAVRTEGPPNTGVAETALVGDIGAQTDWTAALSGVDKVVHLAARAHVIHDSAANATLYYETNAEGTRRLAAAASQACVKRLVYLSSVKVNGEATRDRPFTAADEPRPEDDYGKSKWLAEQHLSQQATLGDMGIVIVRSPLVYGPGVRANFLRLMSLVDKEWPLPLGAVDNARSLVSIWNLCDFLVRVLSYPDACNRTWMVSDGDDLSTPELIRRIGRAMNRRVRLIPVPASLLKLIGGLTGRKAELDRLCGSLAIDVTPTRRELGWSPLLTVDQGIARTVQWYLRGGDSQ